MLAVPAGRQSVPDSQALLIDHAVVQAALLDLGALLDQRFLRRHPLFFFRL